jgi:hypothetical protein
MTSTTSHSTTATRGASAHARGPAAGAVATLVRDLTHGLAGQTPATVLWFASSTYDPTDLAGPLADAFPGATVLGASTAGEFTDATLSQQGVTALALPSGVVRRCAAALAGLDGDAAAGTAAAVAAVESTLGVPLRSLDPARHLGIVLVDGLHGDEEIVNEALGNAAPLLDVVGGSAGDDLAFDRTWVAVGADVSWNGVALLVAELAVPFRVLKTCSFTSTGRTLTVTAADVETRTVLEFDGRPAVVAYADAVGVDVAALDDTVFMASPVGLMVDGSPFIRSPQQVIGDGVRFYCQILEGMEVEVMRGGDLVGDTAAALDAALHDLGGRASAVLAFNCVLRRLEIEARGLGEPFRATFRDLPTAGFHTYGESWLGHMNQTLTGVVFG